jgi:hypothetical protein
MQYIGNGNGQDGDLVISSDTTDSPIDSACTGSSGARTLTVGTGLSFAAGQIVKVIQMFGAGAGNWEFCKVESYNSGTGVLTLETNLINSYVTGAQTFVVKQYKSVTVQSGKVWSVKGWDGSVGGDLTFLYTGTCSIPGSISGTGKGFRGSATVNLAAASQGEGTGSGVGTTSVSANGNGGGGTAGPGSVDIQGGAGGGNGTAGSLGTNSTSGTQAGAVAGSADLTTMVMGGAGAGAEVHLGISGSSIGGIGGGMICAIGNTFVLTGSLISAGSQAVGIASETSSVRTATAGSGAAGSILIKASTATIGINLITALGVAGLPAGGAEPCPGGASGDGRIRIEACSLTDAATYTTNPTASASIGGNAWCTFGGFIY